MIEATILNYLNDVLVDPVYMETPESPPASYVLIDKTGSSKRNKLTRSVFAFQSYADSRYKAAALNEQVKDAVEALVSLNVIGGVSLNSDYNFTDTETKKYRYQAVFDISHY